VDEDVTTLRMTPTLSMGGPPSVTPAVLNGGIRRMDFSWDASVLKVPPRRGVRQEKVISNRCLSAYVIVCPGSSGKWREEDLPPPRALGMCGSSPRTRDGCDGQVRPTLRATGTCEVLPRKSGIVPLDSHRFIDAQCVGLEAGNWRLETRRMVVGDREQVTADVCWVSVSKMMM
jgi:hypothetical protein